MYPLKFKKHLVKKIWGGRSMKDVLGINLPTDELYGESWEVSSHKNGMSYVLNGELEGKSLQELLETYKGELVGDEIYKKYENKFPLLIKYLDINDKLSVQVHPEDEYALKVEGEFGKSECWFILEASDDAKLILGTKEGVTKEYFKEKADNKEFDGLFNIVPVKKGDLVIVKPGLIHASYEGSVLICEPQQNSDTTYRIYDFDRLVDGKYRDLHIDKAVEVITFDRDPEITTEEGREKVMKGTTEYQHLISNEYFEVEKLKITDDYSEEAETKFKTLSIIEGEGLIISDGKEYPILKGDTYFIPANVAVDVKGNVEILKTYAN